eukprot:CAMPEP_0204827764 /NCGR_PEP_ID=MMETSP1346-20131115/5220_1 /ASSEMBLY_ACC=CAM_ASM_000771 /TAXON_ID=215587 /ORGANISM="Aplanochytrium stocchinoi, Strain GSBS06" /LENGTH=321 /DNA_ID=CAMNT_0051956327 /DNA_START=77 /DNA_END=1039 /DNA_ORIENTATION=-
MLIHPLARATTTSLQVAGTLQALKTNRPIGTHDGTFHCDEALACGLLKLLPEFAEKDILRTRNEEILKECEVVVDVGATYDPDNLRFDHHQRSFETKFEDNRCTKLSSAGLVYKHFGKRIISTIATHHKIELNETIEDKIYTKVYSSFIEHVDAIDNGVPAMTGDKNYDVTTSLSARVGSLNPQWNQEYGDMSKGEFTCLQFKHAVDMTLNEFINCVSRLLLHWLPAREYVERAVKNRESVHESKRIIKLEKSVPWTAHLFELEAEILQENKEKLAYVLYQRDSGDWSVQCVPEELGSFTSRLPLPIPYRGLRDDELSKAW